MSNAAGMAALLDVWAAFEEHVAELGELSLPVPVQVSASGIVAAAGEPVLSAQLRGGNVAQLAAGLLAWADTLTTVTAWFWCSEGGLHLYVYGRLTCDRLIQVWGVADLPAALTQPEDSRFAVEIDLSRLRRWAAGVGG
ncbi:hypothetical protein [Actinokineospora sp. NPDC004072]